MLSGPRLRQVALVAADCGQVAGELRRHGEGITEVTIAGPPAGGPWLIGGVRFASTEG